MKIAVNHVQKAPSRTVEKNDPTQLQKIVPLPWPAFKSQRRAPSRATAAQRKKQWNTCSKCHLAAGGFDARPQMKTNYQKNGGFQSVGVPPNQSFINSVFHFEPSSYWGTKCQLLDFDWVLVSRYFLSNFLLMI